MTHINVSVPIDLAGKAYALGLKEGNFSISELVVELLTAYCEKEQEKFSFSGPCFCCGKHTEDEVAIADHVNEEILLMCSDCLDDLRKNAPAKAKARLEDLFDFS